MLNWILRYQPVLDLLQEVQAEEVLDVGSGWHGLSRWWEGDVTQTDLSFHGTPPRDQKRAGRVRFVPANVRQLPFDDDAFDIVVSLDMMEHLPVELRETSVREMTRVARRALIVGYPTGDGARRVDLNLKARREKRGVPTEDWLEEHLNQDAYPTAETLTSALPSTWSVRRRLPSGNARLQEWIVDAESRRGGGYVSRIGEEIVSRIPALARATNFGETYRSIWLASPD